MKIPEHYMEKVYAGWLGKIIGIRLGAAIEGWTYEQIKNVYGELRSYPVAYRNFAADDDSNGPLFFIRSLEDCRDLSRFSAQDVAQALLNYAPYERGFFWWGGYGISTEHTAYLNLRNGIPAPRSGSIEQNGSTAAEQIGGQIFIDPWGLVAPGNPELAASLAEKAASVTHGGNGIYGGVFIACCISLAFVEKDIQTVVEKALAFIPADCEYARVARAVQAFHRAHPEDWRACFAYLKENFGYDKYPGNCHIIPNAGVILLALLYGEGDFEETICICNMCGWDTDCNVGNAACILGVLVGTEGMHLEKWGAPIGDFLACSSVVGSLNATDIPYGAGYFAKMAYLLSGEPVPEKWKTVLENLELCHFEFPESTHAIRCRTPGHFQLLNTGEEAHGGERSLKISLFDISPAEESFIYRQTYYQPGDFEDSRYDPSFSPLVYPGQRVHLSLMPACLAEDFVGTAQLYALDGKSGRILRGEKILLAEKKWYELSLQIPPSGGRIHEIGVILGGVAGNRGKNRISVYLDDLYCTGQADYQVDFATEQEEVWNGIHREISQFTKLKGNAYLEGNALSLSCGDFAEVYTGRYDWKDYRCAVTLKPVTGEDHFLLFRVQGAIRSYGVGLTREGISLVKNQGGYKVLTHCPFSWENGEEYRLTVLVTDSQMEISIGDTVALRYQDEDAPFLRGGVGFSVRQGSHCFYKNLEVKPLSV
jgi:ADP-ribosylglycohydrolase